MKKIISTYLILIFLSSCGYEAMYSKENRKNYNFSISNLGLNGNRDINLKIKERLNNYTLSQKDKDFIIKILSTSEKLPLAKNASGDPTLFKLKVTVEVETLKNGKLQSNFVIIENFDYNNNSNKFELKRYEKEIKNNLANIISDKLIYKLSNI